MRALYQRARLRLILSSPAGAYRRRGTGSSPRTTTRTEQYRIKDL